jgi:mono/diheme cytochrome c family protein
MRAGGRAAVTAGALLLRLLPVANAVHAEDGEAERGRAFAQAHCARCHAIGPSGESPLPKAPPFRTLHQRYPVEYLTEALAEGLRTGHPAMPQFDELEPEQVDDLIAYLKSLER